jgi:hypothetical protein
MSVSTETLVDPYCDQVIEEFGICLLCDLIVSFFIVYVEPKQICLVCT